MSPSRPAATGDLVLPPGRGLPDGLVIPGSELIERFSRSSGPGGQSVNTTDSRVALQFDVQNSAALRDDQKQRLADALGSALVDGTITITAAEHRAQLQNRVAARIRLAQRLSAGLEPPAPQRRATRPSRAAKAARLDSKKRRSSIKATRGRVHGEP